MRDGEKSKCFPKRQLSLIQMAIFHSDTCMFVPFCLFITRCRIFFFLHQKKQISNAWINIISFPWHGSECFTHTKKNGKSIGITITLNDDNDNKDDCRYLVLGHRQK